jgi:CubicO group peptidase (beta-lactamase class C family)
VFAGYDAGGEMILEDCKKSITVQHLLTHTSGLTYGFDGTELINPIAALYQQKLAAIITGFRAGDDVRETAGKTENDRINFGCKSLQEFCDIIAAIPLVFQPGTRWHYGHNTDVLGRVVEVASGGVPLGEFFSKRIFEPLGMTSTGFTLAGGDDPRLADLWYRAASGSGLVNITESARAAGEYCQGRLLVPSGGGGLLSTTSDYCRFAQMLLDGGDGLSRVLSRKSVQWMGTNHLPGGVDMAKMAVPGYTEVAVSGQGFGLGLSVMLDPVANRENASAGSVGWGGLAGTFFHVDPAEDLVVVFMTQTIGLDPLRTATRALITNIVAGAIIDGGLGHKGMQLVPSPKL